MLIITVLLVELAKVINELNAKYQFDRKMWNIIKHKNLLSLIKMGKEISTFSHTEIKKN